MPAQLSVPEQNLIDKMVRQEQKSGKAAFGEINRRRMRKGIEVVDKSAVYRFIGGETHRRGVEETRGRKKALSKEDGRALEKARIKLIKKAKGEKRVTHAQVHEAAGLQNKVCQRVAEEHLRDQGVRYRKPREKIYITETDAKQRLKVCKEWIKKNRTFWSSKVHAYVDNKTFPLPLTAKQRRRRTGAEGPGQWWARPYAVSVRVGRPWLGLAA